MTEGVSGAEAWKRLLDHKHSRWSHDIGRFSAPVAMVAHEPKFPVTTKDRFFCIGSCFARNVEEHLIYNGLKVLSRKIVCPAGEWGGPRLNGFVNKFTTFSMLNELDWVAQRPVIDADLFEGAGEGWRDLQLSTGTPPVTLERAIERRAYLIDDYFARIKSSDVVVLTLGLNEAWFDTRTGRYLNEAPTPASVRRQPERYRLEVTDARQNLAAMEQIHRRLREMNPQVRIVVTVSPVPMFATFSGRDAAVANTYSKAVLRVVAEEFAASHPLVDYFPSYDMVMLAPRKEAFGADCLHVTDAAVGQVIGHFLRLYTGCEPVATEFSEIAYLAANEDVEAAVRRGNFDSGFAHWVAFGKREGRPLRPPPGPKLDLVLAGGA